MAESWRCAPGCLSPLNADTLSPNIPVSLIQSPQSNRSSRSGRSDPADLVDRANRAGEVDEGVRDDCNNRASRADRANRADGGVRADRSNQATRADQAIRANRAGGVDEAVRVDQTTRADQVDRANRNDQVNDNVAMNAKKKLAHAIAETGSFVTHKETKENLHELSGNPPDVGRSICPPTINFPSEVESEYKRTYVEPRLRIAAQTLGCSSSIIAFLVSIFQLADSNVDDTVWRLVLILRTMAILLGCSTLAWTNLTRVFKVCGIGEEVLLVVILVLLSLTMVPSTPWYSALLCGRDPTVSWPGAEEFSDSFLLLVLAIFSVAVVTFNPMRSKFTCLVLLANAASYTSAALVLGSPASSVTQSLNIISLGILVMLIYISGRNMEAAERAYYQYFLHQHNSRKYVQEEEGDDGSAMRSLMSMTQSPVPTPLASRAGSRRSSRVSKRTNSDELGRREIESCRSHVSSRNGSSSTKKRRPNSAGSQVSNFSNKIPSLQSLGERSVTSVETYRTGVHGGREPADLQAFRGFPFKDIQDIKKVYVQQQIIARGSQGLVFQCRRISDGSAFAMKQIHLPGRLARLDFTVNLKNAEREIRCLKQVSGLSPYIVRLEQYWFTPDFNHAYLIMEFLPANLHTIIRKHRKEDKAIPKQNLWRWLRQLVDGLDTIHSFGLIHRDLKPANVLVTAGDETCKIADFGVARLCGREVNDKQSSTSPRSHTSDKDIGEDKNGPVCPEGRRNSLSSDEGQCTDVQQKRGIYTKQAGTVCYSSPEMICGEMYDQRTDIFSLGCVLYELVTLERAYEGAPNAVKHRLSQREEPPRLDTKVHGCDKELVGLCKLMMQVNQSDRPDARSLQSTMDLVRMMAETDKRDNDKHESDAQLDFTLSDVKRPASDVAHQRSAGPVCQWRSASDVSHSRNPVAASGNVADPMRFQSTALVATIERPGIQSTAGEPSQAAATTEPSLPSLLSIASEPDREPVAEPESRRKLVSGQQMVGDVAIVEVVQPSCNKPNSMSSSVDGVEVDEAPALNCNPHRPFEV